MMMNNFVPFYFESNAFWGLVKTQQDWENMKKLFYKDYTLLGYKILLSIYDAKLQEERLYDDKFQKFGFYSEYSGEVTLKDFFLTNNMTMD